MLFNYEDIFHLMKTALIKHRVYLLILSTILRAYLVLFNTILSEIFLIKTKHTTRSLIVHKYVDFTQVYMTHRAIYHVYNCYTYLVITAGKCT